MATEAVCISVSLEPSPEATCTEQETTVVSTSADGEPATVSVISEPAEGLDQVDVTEELPQYESIVVVQTGTDSTDAGIVYENLRNKDVEAATERTLISEAPPTYRQLFGEQRNQNLRQKLSRITQPSASGESLFKKLKKRIENNKLASTFVVSGTILLLLSVPVSMIIIGGLNVGSCWRHEIPLYLLIAGFILIAEVIFQASICFGMKRDTNHETIYRTVRVCDCLALFLFIWLLVGTYWIFTISFARGRCNDQLNDIVYVNTTILTDSEGGTQISVVTSPSTTPPNRGVCASDCDSYVYNFTAFVIMFQYITLLATFIFCCSTYFKKYGRS